jgi:hypothetical protein
MAGYAAVYCLTQDGEQQQETVASWERYERVRCRLLFDSDGEQQQETRWPGQDALINAAVYCSTQTEQLRRNQQDKCPTLQH